MVTVPGEYGVGVAFAAEVVISFIMMSVVLLVSNSSWKSWTGVAAGLLVAFYIIVEGPFSGMSMNPARTLASAIVSGNYMGLWLYFVAPVLGMMSAALVYSIAKSRPESCAKMCHCSRVRCIFCGYEPGK